MSHEWARPMLPDPDKPDSFQLILERRIFRGAKPNLFVQNYDRAFGPPPPPRYAFINYVRNEHFGFDNLAMVPVVCCPGTSVAVLTEYQVKFMQQKYPHFPLDEYVFRSDGSLPKCVTTNIWTGERAELTETGYMHVRCREELR